MLRRAQGDEIAESGAGARQPTRRSVGEAELTLGALRRARRQGAVRADGVGEAASASARSSYEYRTSGRGGKGIVAMVVNDRNGPLVASFPVAQSDQIMLVTDAGQLIRCPVDDVRIAGRNTQGVRIFKTDAEERVVSVEHIPDDGSEGGENGEEDAGNGERTGDDGGAPDAE